MKKLFIALVLLILTCYSSAALGKECTMAFFTAAIRSDKTYLKKLIDEGCDINAKDQLGRTVLMLAAGSGNAETVKFLLENNAKDNTKTKSGETALMMAANRGRSEIIKLLLKKNRMTLM